jgi:hypothetical protein
MKTPTISRHTRRVALWTSGITAVLVLAAFVFISLRIGEEVRAASEAAMARHEGDRVQALILYAEDTRRSFP